MTLGTHVLTPLALGTVVSIHNQRGPHRKPWENSGVVVQLLGNSQYKLRVDKSGRITLCNRVFLRRTTPYIIDARMEYRDSLMVERCD